MPVPRINPKSKDPLLCFPISLLVFLMPAILANP
jgi:hypothetical protein